jgi:outer membrane lipoprotein-sorting protein
MAQFRFAVLAVGFVFAAAVPARADDAADARAIVEKAVKAHGGQEKLDKLPASTVAFKGTFHGMGEGIPLTGEVSVQGPDKQRVEMEIEAGGQKFPIVIILAGDKGWTKIGKDTTEFDKEQLAEANEQAYASWVATLAPLKGKQFKLATAGESEVEKEAALGVTVSSKGHRDVTLYFSKKTGLLVKWETTVKEEGSGKEVTQESFASEYKEVQGTQQAYKFVVKRSGKLHVEGEATKIELFEKLDASLFEKP